MQVECHPDAESEAIIVLSLAALGAVANLSLMGLIIIRFFSILQIYIKYVKSHKVANISHKLANLTLMGLIVVRFL